MLLCLTFNVAHIEGELSREGTEELSGDGGDKANRQDRVNTSLR